ncbi:MAG: putative C-S lyase [Myxococcales bacterium]|nr:putative C-S lyase [Myxococcales bacterium]
MLSLEFPPLRFLVEHRETGSDLGPTLRVLESESGRERLRFDCFENRPHYHFDPAGRNEVNHIERSLDPIAWTLSLLERDLVGCLSRAGLESAPFPPDALGPLLAKLDTAMRNPPLDLEVFDVDSLRARRGEKWRTYPADVLPAWVADMDFPLAGPIQRVLRTATEIQDVGYPVNPRPRDLPTLFSERMRDRFAWEPDPARCEVLTDVVQGIYIALLTLSDPGDGVCTLTPIYPPFLSALEETGRRLVHSSLVQGSRGFEIDFDELGEQIDAGTRILLLSHPHNPSGRAFSREELGRLAELALQRDLLVISDEIHADLVYPGRAHLPFASLGPEVEARTITLNSATKAFNIAGLRCAVGAFGSRDLHDRFLSIPRHVRGGIGSLGLSATVAAWKHSQPWLDHTLVYLRENRDFLAERVARHLPGVVHFPPEATYLAWLDFRALDLPRGPYAFFLENARVALSDGARFGPGGEGAVRVNFATPRPILTELLERMEKAVAAG